MIDGKFKHECPTYSGLLIDETCIEFASCECFSGDEFIKAKAAAEDYGDEYMATHAKWVREGGALPDFGGVE